MTGNGHFILTHKEFGCPFVITEVQFQELEALRYLILCARDAIVKNKINSIPVPMVLTAYWRRQTLVKELYT